MLGARPLVELGHEVGEGGLRLGPHEVLGQAHQRRQGLPAVADGARSGGGLGRPAAGGEHRAHLGRHIGHVGELGVGVAPGAGRAAQQQPGLAHLGALEEPLGAAQLVGHPGIGEGLLVHLGLGVDAVEDRDLARRDPGGNELADPAGGALGLCGLVRELGVDRLGAGAALGDQLQPVLGGAAAGLGEQAVGQLHHLGCGAVVPHELDDSGVRVTVAEIQQVVGGVAPVKE
ncbi:hypothetical protein GCM10020000_27450 [Streptomyces olivoverticillatus]